LVVLLVCFVPVAVLVAAACSRAPAAGGGVVGADAGDAEASENDAIDVTGVLLDLSGDDVLKCFLTGGKIEAASLRESLESCGAPSPGAKIETPALPGLERALRACLTKPLSGNDRCSTEEELVVGVSGCGTTRFMLSCSRSSGHRGDCLVKTTDRERGFPRGNPLALHPKRRPPDTFGSCDDLCTALEGLVAPPCCSETLCHEGSLACCDRPIPGTWDEAALKCRCPPTAETSARAE